MYSRNPLSQWHRKHEGNAPIKFMQLKISVCPHTGMHTLPLNHMHNMHIPNETQWEGARSDGTEMDRYILWPPNLIPQFVMFSALAGIIPTKGNEPIAAATPIIG